MDTGLLKGREFYPIFKKLADSINALTNDTITKNEPVKASSVFITSYEVKGLKKTTMPFFIHLMDFYDHKTYTAALINKKIRRAYGSRYYASISYSLLPIAKIQPK